MEILRSYLDNLLHSSGFSTDHAALLTHLILVMATALLAWAAFMVCHKIIVPTVIKITRKTEVEWDDVIFNPRTMRAACKIVPAIVVWKLLPHTFYRYPMIEELLLRVTAIYITMTSMWLGIAVIDSLKQLEGDRRTALQQYFHTFCGVLKIAIIFVAIIVMVAIAINRSPLTLFAGLGATSAILMLVFKDTISGLVAGIRLTSNDMLHKGDWITVNKANINGIVEDITLTTVKVRNFDNTIITITPQTLVDDSFQNWKGMQQSGGRRMRKLVYIDIRSIRLATDELKDQLIRRHLSRPEETAGEVVNLTLFRRYMERWLQKQEEVNADMTFMVRQMEATPTGLPIEIYCFVKQKEWKPYEHTTAGIMEHVYATAPLFGLRVYQRCSDCQQSDTPHTNVSPY